MSFHGLYLMPPHEFNLDFPHLMLRARAVEKRKGKVGFVRRQLVQTDRNGKLAGPVLARNGAMSEVVHPACCGMPLLEQGDLAAVAARARLVAGTLAPYIERGGEEQIADELAAYNPLVPQGRDLVATLMFEIDEPERRDKLLRSLTGVEDTVSIKLGGEVVRAIPELGDRVERTRDDGKTSSIHFLHFPISDSAIARFKSGQEPIVAAIEHESYGHMALIPENVRQALAADFGG